MTTTSTRRGYLGIDNGTQGISVIFTDESLHVLATGEASYGMVPNLPEGWYEQNTQDWEDALQQAMEQVRQQLNVMTAGDDDDFQVLAIGISGQMHGEVLSDDHGHALGPVRLWCDARNEAESTELTTAWGVKIAKRSTVARFLWTVRHTPARAQATRHMTTPAGWISFCLTGQYTLGIGDASGMFPIHPDTLDYDPTLLAKFDEEIVNDPSIPSLASLLPQVCRAGQDAGCLNERGARLLGLPVGIPVAPAEGDQPAALAGSLIGQAGMVSCSFGTSVCANVVANKTFVGVSPAVDHFCAVDGHPIHMVWLRNGTTYLNTMVEHYGKAMQLQQQLPPPQQENDTTTFEHSKTTTNVFARVMPELVQAPPDCGGLLALPFMDDEPGFQIPQGGTALIMGWNPTNATVGNVTKAALLATMFNLHLGCDVLEQQGVTRTELVLSGGLTKTPACGQILADVFDTPTTLLESAEEGSGWGAALLAKFRHVTMEREASEGESTANNNNNNDNGNIMMSWVEFLETIQPKGRRHFVPDSSAVGTYQTMYQRYKKLIALQSMLQEAAA
jgi:sugar (pentulose or hexulose) kinase